MPEPTESTLVLIKPDALKLSLTGYILSNFSEIHTGLRMAGTKIVQVSRMLARAHYAEHQGKPFYETLLDYLTGLVHYPDEPGSRRVVALVYAGPGAVGRCRSVAGPTDPHVARDTAPSTMRALGTVVQGPHADYAERIDNLVHTSSDAAAAEREIRLWFRPVDLTPATRFQPTEVCRESYYYRDGELLDAYADGAVCLVVPGSLVWAADLARLRVLRAGTGDRGDLEAVAAKYLINTAQQ